MATFLTSICLYWGSCGLSKRPKQNEVKASKSWVGQANTSYNHNKTWEGRHQRLACHIGQFTPSVTLYTISGAFTTVRARGTHLATPCPPVVVASFRKIQNTHTLYYSMSSCLQCALGDRSRQWMFPSKSLS